MLYQEQEIGDYDALRRMIWARRFLPELGAGEPDYFASTLDPRVFTVVSTLSGSRAIALVNLSGNSVSGDVSLSPSLHIAPGNSVYDAVSGRAARIIDGKFAWTLAPYETALMRIGKHPAGQAPSEVFAGETYPGVSPAPTSDLVWRQGALCMDLNLGGGTWTRAVSGATTTLESPSGRVTLGRTDHGTAVQIDLAAGAPAPRLVVRGADRWLVSGRTAVLSDRVLRRHFPFPAGSNYTWNRKIIWGSGPWGSLYDRVAACGRLWQSILEPLHPTEPGLQFTDRAGAGFALTGLNTNAGNVVLTDCTDETDVEPYRLETRFYAADPDLSPVVRAFGLGTQWQVDWASFPPPQSRDLHVSFVIEPSKAAEPHRFTAPRLPVQRSGMHESDIGPKTKFMFSYATWMPEPGEIHWDGFAPVPGVYRIEFELRHSEGSPTGTDLDNAYRVLVDGLDQPLTWVKRGTSTFGNSYFGFAQTPPIDLSGKTHSISIATNRPWAGVREHYRLVKEQK